MRNIFERAACCDFRNSHRFAVFASLVNNDSEQCSNSLPCLPQRPSRGPGPGAVLLALFAAAEPTIGPPARVPARSDVPLVAARSSPGKALRIPAAAKWRPGVAVPPRRGGAGRHAGGPMVLISESTGIEDNLTGFPGR